MSIDKDIAFLGGGNMAEALIKGMLAAGTAKPEQMLVTDVSADRLAHLQKSYGVVALQNNGEAVSRSGITMLCVKPQVMDRVLQEITGATGREKLVISIAAGVTIARIEEALTSG